MKAFSVGARGSDGCKVVYAVSVNSNTELFAQQCAFSVKLVVFRCEMRSGMDAVGGPGTRVYNGVVG